MLIRPLAIVFLLAVCAVLGCRATQPSQDKTPASKPSKPNKPGSTAPSSTAATAPRRAESAAKPAPGAATATASQVIAYLNGEPLRRSDLEKSLMEAAGGEVLTEMVLERAVRRALADAELKLTEAHLLAEQRILGQSVTDTADAAARVLREVRERRGPTRFQRRMSINAGLRLLVKGEVKVTDFAVRKAYQQAYGETFEARIVVVEELLQAGPIVRRARAGEDFAELASKHSTDATRVVGGLLPPISPLDATYPDAIRRTLAKLTPGQVSDPIDLDSGFAILKLVRKNEAQRVEFADVKDGLARQVRRQLEQMMMTQRARALLQDANVVVFDPALKRGWERQRDRLTASP